MNNERIMGKIKSMTNFISFYRGFFFISSISTILITLTIIALFEEDKFYIQNFINNWNKKPIIDIKFTNEDCGESYEQSTLGYWPVSSNLCDCTNSYFYSFSTSTRKKVIKPYRCSMLLKFIGCNDSEDVKRIDINQWKGNRICTKRMETSYLQNLLAKNNHKSCNCKSTDSLNTKVCSNFQSCPITNKDVFDLGKTNIVNFFNKKNETNTKRLVLKKRVNSLKPQSRTSNVGKSKNPNYTTYVDLENAFHKNFNITMNNEILSNLALSDIFISEHFPCLIPINYKKVNEVGRLFNFVLNNIDYIKNISNNITPTIQFRKILLNEINLKFLDRKDCYLFENTYFDKRYYLLDIINFYEFFLLDIQDQNLNKNLSFSANLNYFTPTTTMFLLTSPFYGWNFEFCHENPLHRMEKIIGIYNSESNHSLIIVFLNILCFIYVTTNGIFEKILEEYHFALYTNSPQVNKSKRNNYQLFFDFIFYLLKIICLCLIVKICFTLKNLTYNEYLFLIRNDCMDQTSTKLLTYLFDICEEKFIYCIFMLSFNVLEFLIFTIIFKNSYELKLTLK